MKTESIVEKLTQKYKEMIVSKGGKDITCLSDKEIVKTAFAILSHRIYDECASEGIVKKLDSIKKGWDEVGVGEIC